MQHIERRSRDSHTEKRETNRKRQARQQPTHRATTSTSPSYEEEWGGWDRLTWKARAHLNETRYKRQIILVRGTMMVHLHDDDNDDDLATQATGTDVHTLWGREYSSQRLAHTSCLIEEYIINRPALAHARATLSLVCHWCQSPIPACVLVLFPLGFKWWLVSNAMMILLFLISAL